MIPMKLWPLIKRYRKIFAAMSLMLALGMALVVGLVNGCYSFTDAVDRYFEDYHFPGFTVLTQLCYPSETTDEMEQTLQGAQTRLVLDAQVSIGADRLTTGRCFFETSRALASHYAVLESTQVQKDVVHARVDYFFSRWGGLALGDQITVKSALGTFHAVISEVCAGPENFVVYRNAFSLFDRTDFGYLYFDGDEVARTLGIPALPQNQWLFDKDSDKDEIVSALSERYQVLGHFTRAESAQQKNADMDIDPIWLISIVLPSIIFLISIIIAALFMMQIVQDQRQEIGLLRALGYSAGQIVSLYAAFGLVVSLAAIILGAAGGTLLCGFISDLYGKAYALPEIARVYQAAPYLISMGVVLLMGQASAAISALLVTRIDPVEAMRAVPKQKSAKLPPMRGWPELMKMQLRSALRNRRRTVLSILSVAITGILICIATSYATALDNVIDDTLATKYLFDAQISFDSWMSPAEMAERLSGIYQLSAVEYAGYQITELSFNGRTETVMLCGVPENSQMIRPQDERGVPIAVDGLVMANYTAREMHVQVGDTVDVNGRRLPVTAISYQNAQYTQYMPLALLGDIAGSGAFTCALANMADKSAENELSRVLQDVEHFDYVTYTRTIRSGLDAFVTTLRPAVTVVLACGLLIGYLIIYNLTAISMGERKRDYAILMTQGMSAASIVRSTFAELLAEFLLSLAVTAAVGIPATRIALAQMNTQQISFRNPKMGETFWWVAALVFLYMAVANAAAMLPIRKIDLSDALKERE